MARTFKEGSKNKTVHKNCKNWTFLKLTCFFPLKTRKHLTRYQLKAPNFPRPPHSVAPRAIITPLACNSAPKHIIGFFVPEKSPVNFHFLDIGTFIRGFLQASYHLVCHTTCNCCLLTQESCFPCLPFSQVKILRYDHIAEKEQREDKINK